MPYFTNFPPKNSPVTDEIERVHDRDDIPTGTIPAFGFSYPNNPFKKYDFPTPVGPKRTRFGMV